MVEYVFGARDFKQISVTYLNTVVHPRHLHNKQISFACHFGHACHRFV